MLAWPDAASPLAGGLGSALILTGVAVWLDLPVFHLPAGAFLTLAYLVLVHMRGVIGWDFAWRRMSAGAARRRRENS